MNIEEEVFDRYETDIEKLKEHGFTQKDGILSYSIKLPKDEFRLDISYDGKKFEGHIIDLDMKEEYIYYRRDRRSRFSESV